MRFVAQFSLICVFHIIFTPWFTFLCITALLFWEAAKCSIALIWQEPGVSCPAEGAREGEIAGREPPGKEMEEEIKERNRGGRERGEEEKMEFEKVTGIRCVRKKCL